MKAGGSGLLRVCGVALAAVIYAVLAHRSNLSPADSRWSGLLAIAPLLLLGLILALRARRRLPALFLVAIAVLLIAHFWPPIARHAAWLYLTQQTGAYVFLCLLFGSSLSAGRIPLCTQWAALVHGPLSVSALRYTRQVTFAWTLLFACIAAALVALFALAPLRVWSAFANFGTVPLLAAMFAGEYLVRERALPDMRHAGIWAGIRAYLDSTHDAARSS